MHRTVNELWFPVGDLLPIVEHSLTADTVEPDPEHGTQPVLWLMAQDRLRYLTTNATPPQLVDAFNPTSRQRVYAIGHSYHISGRSFPAPEEFYGPPTRLGAIPLRGDAHHPRYPVRLVDQLRRASRVGCEWLAIRLGTDGPERWEVHPFPHPAPAAAWHERLLELSGVPGRWPGRVVTNATHDGWLLPRFTPAVAEQIVAALAGAPQLPSPVTTVQLIQAADTGEAGVVGMDPDGFYRLGRGWPWVCPDLLPNGQLLPYTATDQPGIDPAELPAPGQDTFTGLGYLMWLDEHDELVLRPIHPDGLHPADQAAPPDYGDLDAEDEPQFRAVEHVLRQAATSRVTLTGPAAAFTAADIEARLITAADAVCAGMDALSSRQIDLATRAYQLLVADDDDADSTDADSARG